jgi:hypothetical protein
MMTPNEQNKAIAKYCSWKHRDGGMWYNPGGSTVGEELIPNYHSDLNAMHEAEKKLTGDDQSLYYDYCSLTAGWKSKTLEEARWESTWNTFRATSQQRAKAFLRTIGKWKE